MLFEENCKAANAHHGQTELAPFLHKKCSVYALRLLMKLAGIWLFFNTEDKIEDSGNDNADSQEDNKFDEENKQSVLDDADFKVLLSSDNFDELLEKADSFFLGTGVEEVDSKAFMLYQRCSELSPQSTYVMACLGQCYLNGYGVESDTDKAYRLVVEAAKHNEALGIRVLARMYRDGLGVPQDAQKAIQLFTRLAENGDDDAQSSLGDMFFFGEGVPVDYVEARKWYLLAAKKDNEVALDNLGLLYMNGYGVEQSVETANEYWTRASSHGSVSYIFSLIKNFLKIKQPLDCSCLV